MTTLSKNAISLFALLLLATALGCGGDLVPADDTADDTSTREVSAPAAAVAGQRVVARGLAFDLPGDWVTEPPASPMRLVQASIPGAGGAGQFTVFHFGEGGGGGVEENLQRWIGQMERSSSEGPERQVVESGEYRATWVDVAGTLKASTIGSFPPTDMPDYVLLGAVVEGPGGPWFLRAVGPEQTMAEQREAFVSMLESVRGE